MEQIEGFKSIGFKIKALEQQLALCGKTINELAQSEKDAEKEIEGHFARCMSALADRKATLLQDLALKIANQSMFYSLSSLSSISWFILGIVIENSRAKVATSLEVCKQTLQLGVKSYEISPSAADAVWKVLFLLFLSYNLAFIKFSPIPQFLLRVLSLGG
jgi:hypothetical protein